MDTAYERALEEVGSNDKFQRRFDVVYNVLMAATWVMACMNVVLILVVVPHTCKIPPRVGNVTEYEWKMKHLPLVVDPKGELTFSNCFKYDKPGEDNVTTACTSFDYDQTWYESTAVTDHDWVCEKELNVANIYAYSRLGEMVGSVAVGWFGDTYGRRGSYTIAITLTLLGRVITLLSGNSLFFFMGGCFVSAFPSWLAPQSTLVISMETSSPRRRTTINTLKGIGTTLGMSVMPLLYWFLRDWRWFMVATTVGLVPFILLSWTIIESPRWLWLQGRPEESIRVLKKIARVNGKRLDSITERELLTSTPPAESKVLGPLALFSSGMLILNTTLQLILWICISMSYMILIMTTGENSSENPFLDFAWQSIAEIPGTLLSSWMADRLGRRYSGAVSFGISAGLWIVVAARTNTSFSWLQSPWAGTLTFMLLRLTLTAAYNIINLFNMELYPTCLRQSGMALGNVLASAAGALGPYILYMGRNMDTRLPGRILSGISLLGALCFLLLPETLNKKLPETLEDAKNFGGGDRKYFSLRLQRPGSASVGKDSMVYYTSDVKSSV